MSGKFITNKEKLLSDTIEHILPTCYKIDILVGFFYFSGFFKFAKKFKDKKIRVLIGMDTEVLIKNLVAEYENEDINNIKNRFFKQFKSIFNNTDYFDNKDFYDAVDIFISKIKDKTLQIKKTLEPNHSKLYLFYEKEETSHFGDRPGTLITGSSNLSFSGLSGRYELNVRFDDKQTFEEGKEIFDELWEKSIEITNGGDNDEFIKLLKNETWLKKVSPYECYIKVLHEYFKTEKKIQTPYELTNGKFKNLDYQVDAIKDGIKILNEHNGVIISDVVGLGKSIIGASLIGNILKKKNDKAIIIAPPHLVDQWKDYQQDFDIHAKVYSSGKIDSAVEDDKRSTTKARVVLIDEAHKYRNANTKDYAKLHQLCQGKKVILLTATPFNNEPNDIFNLIKLFQIPTNPTLHTKRGLIEDFSKLQNEYLEIRKKQREDKITQKEANYLLKNLSMQIREIISPILIRRSRIDLEKIKKYNENLKEQGYEFSKLEDPKELNFTLGDIQKQYEETLTKLVEKDKNGNYKYFKGARYKGLIYIKKDKLDKYKKQLDDILGYEYELLEGRQKNMPFFIRRLLTSRFESSIFSFKKTLNKIIKSTKDYIKFIDKIGGIPIIRKGTLPDFDDIISNEDEILEEDIRKIENELISRNGIIIKKEDLKDTFIKDLKKDLDFLEDLHKKWNNINYDPKLENFIDKIEELRKENPKRKIVVFSMFSDTVNYIYEKLDKKFQGRVLKVTGSTKTSTLKNDIKLNFDAGVPEDEQKDDYDILLGTDSISEGYNLHRAGVIINYDIPYNPTKVIQRVGRINRINKKVFDKLYIYNYFPSFTGEKYTNIAKISKLKIHMISIILGVDAKILSKEEKIGSFYKRIIDEDNSQTELSWDVEYRNDYNDAIKDKKILKSITKLPGRIKILRLNTKNSKGMIMFIKKGNNLIFYYYDELEGKVLPLSIPEAFAIFKAFKEEKSYSISDTFFNKYEILKSFITQDKLDPLNPQVKKALNNVKSMSDISKEDYYKDLYKVVEKQALPKYYMKKLRNITSLNFEEEMKEIKKEISHEYLKTILSISKDFDEKKIDLIITEEFNNIKI